VGSRMDTGNQSSAEPRWRLRLPRLSLRAEAGDAATAIPVSGPTASLPSLATLRASLARLDVARRSRRIADAALVMPALGLNGLRYGVVPTVPSAILISLREGLSDVHWKTIGDALVRVIQHSGPLLTKLGQILATRGDLLPEPVCVRLEALYTR